MNNSKHNIKPCWWGTHLWQTIYCMVAVYPDNPSKEQIESIRNFFKGLKYLLPCEGCQESYSKFSCDKDTNIDNLENFRTRENLIMFVYTLRNKVNSKLTHEYYIDINYFRTKLNSMLATENNINDGKVTEMIEAPFIPKELEKKVFKYINSFSDYDSDHTKKILEISKKFMEEPSFDYQNKTFRFVYKRNKKCRNIIKKIYLRMSEGKYDLIDSFNIHDKNLHNTLLFLGCTILHKENLKQLLDMKLNN
jgi:hypothetical protein